MVKGDVLNNEPFIIQLDEKDLPNLTEDKTDSCGFVYNKTNIWGNNQKDVSSLLAGISEKLDCIINLLSKNGRE